MLAGCDGGGGGRTEGRSTAQPTSRTTAAGTAPAGPRGRPAPADAPGAAGPTDPAPAADQQRAAVVAALLAVRSAAVLHHDAAGWLSVLDPAADGLVEAERAQWPVVAALPVSHWAYVVESVDVVDASTWRARVRLDYAVRGTDDGPVGRELDVSLVERALGWRVSAERPTDTSTLDPWQLAPARVLGDRTALVVVSTAEGDPAPWLAVADRAAARVASVLGPAHRRPLVLVPERSPTTASLVAVAQGRRVLVSAPEFDGLSPVGRLVVLAHELTHVALAGPSEAPAWLEEGFADWVGYTGSGIGVQAAAAELLAEVQRSGAPRALPADPAFDVSRGGSPEAYESAWTACRVLASRGGTARLVRFVRLAQADGYPAALARVYALRPAQLTALWRAELARLAEG